LDKASAFELYKQLSEQFGSGVTVANNKSIDEKQPELQTYSITVPAVTISVKAQSVDDALKIANDQYSII
jgi:hypothetical protein